MSSRAGLGAGRLPRTLAAYLERAAEFEGVGLRVLDRRGHEQWLPWPVVYNRARAVAGGLQALGVAHGDRVALVFPTCAGFFDACFGILVAGGVPVPLYPPVRLGRLEEYHERTARMVRAAGARLVLADRRVRLILGETVRSARPPLGCLTLEELPRADARTVDIGERDLGLVQFSSGTTREPKAVALSNRALVAQAQLLNGYWPETEGMRDAGVSWLPLYHDMGLIGCVFTALERPGTLTVLPPETFVARPAAWLQAISRYRATISPAPNFAYSLCLSRITDEDMENVDLSSWRVALNGAEHAVPEVMRAFNERFARWGLSPSALTPVYGLSEASLAVTFTEVRRPFVARRFDRGLLSEAGIARACSDGREVASVGTPLPGVELRVVSDTGEPLPEGRVGQIECRGPCLMDGYLGDPDATAALMREGWLATGDLGFLFDGELYLSGRAKDMLLLRGRNHAPDEVERAVERVDGVRAGCVVAVSWLPEEAEGEQLLVFAEARRDVPPTRFVQIAEACGQAVVTALGLAPERVVILAPGTLPRTSSGKLRRQEALRQFLAGALSAPRLVTPLTMAAAVARSSIAYVQARWKDGRKQDDGREN